MPLPVKQAAELAKTMADKGLSGSISMGESKPMEMPADEEGPESDMSEDMEACLSDVADAILSGDKQSIMDGLKELMERWASYDEEQDAEGSEEGY